MSRLWRAALVVGLNVSLLRWASSLYREGDLLLATFNVGLVLVIDVLWFREDLSPRTPRLEQVPDESAHQPPPRH
jgi:hypothetical protein